MFTNALSKIKSTFSRENMASAAAMGTMGIAGAYAGAGAVGAGIKGAYKGAKAGYAVGNAGEGMMKGAKLAMKHGYKRSGLSATSSGAIAGAGYGAMSDDTSMVGGAFMGAGMGYAGRKLKNSIY